MESNIDFLKLQRYVKIKILHTTAASEIKNPRNQKSAKFLTKISGFYDFIVERLTEVERGSIRCTLHRYWYNLFSMIIPIDYKSKRVPVSGSRGVYSVEGRGRSREAPEVLVNMTHCFHLLS